MAEGWKVTVPPRAAKHTFREIIVFHFFLHPSLAARRFSVRIENVSLGDFVLRTYEYHFTAAAEGTKYYNNYQALTLQWNSSALVWAVFCLFLVYTHRSTVSCIMWLSASLYTSPSHNRHTIDQVTFSLFAVLHNFQVWIFPKKWCLQGKTWNSNFHDLLPIIHSHHSVHAARSQQGHGASSIR